MVEKIRRGNVIVSLATVIFCFGAGFVSVAGGQANDLCQNATLLTVPSFTSDCTIGALFDVVPECDGVTNDSPGIWYKVIGTGNEITASLCSANTDFDTRLSVCCSGCADSKCIAAKVILDNIINLPDYAILSAEYGCTIGCAGDVNGDGKTDLVDVIIMANNWLCVGTN